MFSATIAGGQMDDLISPEHLEWFKSRGISKETLRLGRIYSAKLLPSGEHEASFEGRILAFPFVHCNKVVNIKYRGPNKSFYQSGGGEKVFWNCDCISDSSVQDGTNPLVITEGEIDALSFIEAGYPFVVSVPNGAPAPHKGAPRRPIDPENDVGFSYLLKAWDSLKVVKSIVIATDNDEPGKNLGEELVRRLGRARCKFVTYPDGCKDANDVLVKCGKNDTMRLIADAKPYPVSGLYTYYDLPPQPQLRPVTSGWFRLDELLLLHVPGFMVITGKSNHGKSLWANQLVAQLAHYHGWPVAIASYEMRLDPFVTGTLKAAYKMAGGELDSGDWINNNFCFIAPKSSEEEDDANDIEWLLERARTAVIRHGIRVLLIDPWNEIDHTLDKGETVTDYTSRAIRKLKRFAMENEVLVIVVAHPAKGPAQSKSAERIDLYDIADTAHFSNKADWGVCVARIEGSNESQITVCKVRNEPVCGRKGMLPMSFHPDLGIFGQ